MVIWAILPYELRCTWTVGMWDDIYARVGERAPIGFKPGPVLLITPSGCESD
jgi:hypothetical protein